MDDNQIIFKIDDAPLESDKVEETKVKFQRKWAFWENYTAKEESAKLDYEKTMKEIFKFEDIITFWQFWNHYPGSSPSNIFYNEERLR